MSFDEILDLTAEVFFFSSRYLDIYPRKRKQKRGDSGFCPPCLVVAGGAHAEAGLILACCDVDKTSRPYTLWNHLPCPACAREKRANLDNFPFLGA